MMNLLQRSLRSGDASSTNANPSNSSKPNKTSSGVMGGLHNSGPLTVGSSSGYSTNDHSYFKNVYDPYFSLPGSGYYNNLPSNLPFDHLENQPLLNQNQSDCKKKHIHHTHDQHSNSQSQRSSAMSNYPNDFANYGKLFPASCLQYLHQHNHIEELIVAQQLFDKLAWNEEQPTTVNYKDKFVTDNFRSKQLKAHPNEFEALGKYTYNDKQQDQIVDSYTVPIFRNNQFGSVVVTHCPLNYERNIFGYQSSNLNDYYRISFLETHIYQAQDLNTSPQHQPQFRGNNQQFMHNEWIKTNLTNLRNYFKPSYNEILVNVEKKAKYPFIIFGNPCEKFNSSNGLADPFRIMPTATSINLSHELRITDGLFEICDYVLTSESLFENYDDGVKKSPLGYIISTYQTFPGEDNEKLEERWWYWTGASYLSKALPSNIGLGKLVFFKRRDLHLLKSDCLKQFVDNELPIFTYVLFCELFNLKEAHLSTTCKIIDQLRARCCGYTALYINCT